MSSTIFESAVSFLKTRVQTIYQISDKVCANGGQPNDFQLLVVIYYNGVTPVRYMDKRTSIFTRNLYVYIYLG